MHRNQLVILLALVYHLWREGERRSQWRMVSGSGQQQHAAPVLFCAAGSHGRPACLLPHWYNHPCPICRRTRMTPMGLQRRNEKGATGS